MAAVALGGALGGIARHLILMAVAARFGHAATGTFAVNASGAFVIGLVAGALYLRVAITGEPMTIWLLLVTGILGSYTTVSAFALETLQMLERENYMPALVNVLASVGVCLGCAAAGYAATSWVFG